MLTVRSYWGRSWLWNESRKVFIMYARRIKGKKVIYSCISRCKQLIWSKICAMHYWAKELSQSNNIMDGILTAFSKRLSSLFNLQRLWYRSIQSHQTPLTKTITLPPITQGLLVYCTFDQWVCLCCSVYFYFYYHHWKSHKHINQHRLRQ